MTVHEYKNLNGIVLSLPNRSFTPVLFSLDLPEQSTDEIDDTDLASTVKKTFAGPVIDAGELTGSIRYVPGTAIAIGQVDELVRITMPMLTGQSVAGKYEFQGHITKVGAPKAANNGRSEVPITIKVNSIPVWTEGT